MNVSKKTELAFLPEYVAVEVTNVCNFKCAFCPQSDPNHHDIVPMTYLDGVTLRRFLTKIRDAGIKTNVMHWTLDGEPFMNKKFGELFEVGLEFGFTNSYFASNGMLATVERLLTFPVDRAQIRMAIDFCADPDYFEDVRGTKGSWAKVRDNIRGLLSHEKLTNIFIDVTDISSFSVKDEEELLDNYRRLKALFEPNERLRFRTRTFHNATGYLEGMKDGQNDYHVCPYPWTHLRVASNGDIVACCRDLQHKTVLGNLERESVAEIWNGRLMQDLRRALLDGEPQKAAACADCDLPYDSAKFSARNLLDAAKGRLQLFSD
jgi:radical SAM protein with 4Fe4S-binding SPASM domain